MRLFFVIVSAFLTLSARAQSSAPVASFDLVNSPYDEQSPVISPDGTTLFLTVANHPQNAGGKKDPGDIWISRLIGNQWSAPVHGGMLLNNRSYNAVAGISKNGSRLYLHGHYDISGNTARTQGISVSTEEGGGWSTPVNIVIPYYRNTSGILSGSVAADGSVFVFSAETFGTRGVDDLFVCVNENGKWSEPKNLGPSINTAFQEVSPWLSPDGRTLYFSSNGRNGNGSFDIYSATRLDEGWTSWSEPENLGPDINSSGRELYYRYQDKPGYSIFTSTINSDGYGDIKFLQEARQTVVNSDSVLVQPDTATTVETASDTALAEKQVHVTGKITNTKTGEAIRAAISFAGNRNFQKEITSSEEGYTLDVPASQTYNIAIEAPGFISSLEKLDIGTDATREIEMNFGLRPVEIGTTVNLKNVLFAQGKTDILPESYPELDLVVHFLTANPNVRIELAGHTDNRGVHADNVKLSRQRVNKVKEYLVSKGIDSKRITGKGYGGTKPIASNDTEESRRMNRRVEFTIRKF